MTVEPARIRDAWPGRVSGCTPGKPLQVLSLEQGHAGPVASLLAADALPLRDDPPLLEGTLPAQAALVTREFEAQAAT